MPSMMFKIVRTSNSQFKSNYLKNEKLFLNFLFHFWKLYELLNKRKKRNIVIANVVPKLQTVKNLVRPLYKKVQFRTCFYSQHVKAFQIMAKSPCEFFYPLFLSFSGKLIWKLSPLVLGEIFGVFVNTSTSDDKYPVQDCKNLPLPI